MFNCANCGKECVLHRYYQSDDSGKVTSRATDTPTYYVYVDAKFIPFCGAECGTLYYSNNIQTNANLTLKLGKYITK